MNRIFILCLIGLVACTPDTTKENLATGQVASDSTGLEQVVDSISNARKDGTATTSIPLDVKQQIPEELELELNRAHSPWKLPALLKSDVERVPKAEEGPYFIRGDFNGDKQQDYAVQVVERDSAFVYAFLRGPGNRFKEYLLERHVLSDIEGQKGSIHYLTLAKKDRKYYNYATKENVVLPNDGISVGAENYTATYVWENGKFRKMETGD